MLVKEDNHENRKIGIAAQKAINGKITFEEANNIAIQVEQNEYDKKIRGMIARDQLKIEEYKAVIKSLDDAINQMNYFLDNSSKIGAMLSKYNIDGISLDRGCINENTKVLNEGILTFDTIISVCKKKIEELNLEIGALNNNEIPTNEASYKNNTNTYSSTGKSKYEDSSSYEIDLPDILELDMILQNLGGYISELDGLSTAISNIEIPSDLDIDSSQIDLVKQKIDNFCSNSSSINETYTRLKNVESVYIQCFGGREEYFMNVAIEYINKLKNNELELSNAEQTKLFERFNNIFSTDYNGYYSTEWNEFQNIFQQALSDSMLAGIVDLYQKENKTISEQETLDNWYQSYIDLINTNNNSLTSVQLITIATISYNLYNQTGNDTYLTNFDNTMSKISMNDKFEFLPPSLVILDSIEKKNVNPEEVFNTYWSRIGMDDYIGDNRVIDARIKELGIEDMYALAILADKIDNLEYNDKFKNIVQAFDRVNKANSTLTTEQQDWIINWENNCINVNQNKIISEMSGINGEIKSIDNQIKKIEDQIKSDVAREYADAYYEYGASPIMDQGDATQIRLAENEEYLKLLERKTELEGELSTLNFSSQLFTSLIDNNMRRLSNFKELSEQLITKCELERVNYTAIDSFSGAEYTDSYIKPVYYSKNKAGEEVIIDPNLDQIALYYFQTGQKVPISVPNRNEIMDIIDTLESGYIPSSDIELVNCYANINFIENGNFEYAAIRLDNIINNAIYLEGKDMAQEVINKINSKDTAFGATCCLVANNFVDGIINNFNGLANLFSEYDRVSTREYKTSIITEWANNNMGNVSNTLGELGIVIGNMVPAIALGTIGGWLGVLAESSSAIAITSAALQVASRIEFGVSAAGNYKHEGLENGMSVDAATVYGLIAGASEVCLENLIGSMPGLSKLKKYEGLPIAAQFFLAGAGESVEEWLQDVLNPFFQAVSCGITNEDGMLLFADADGNKLSFDQVSDQIDWKEAFHSGKLGFLSGGFFAAPKLSLGVYSTIKYGNSAVAETVLRHSTSKVANEIANEGKGLLDLPSIFRTILTTTNDELNQISLNLSEFNELKSTLSQNENIINTFNETNKGRNFSEKISFDTFITDITVNTILTFSTEGTSDMVDSEIITSLKNKRNQLEQDYFDTVEKLDTAIEKLSDSNLTSEMKNQINIDIDELNARLTKLTTDVEKINATINTYNFIVIKANEIAIANEIAKAIYPETTKTSLSDRLKNLFNVNNDSNNSSSVLDTYNSLLNELSELNKRLENATNRIAEYGELSTETEYVERLKQSIKNIENQIEKFKAKLTENGINPDKIASMQEEIESKKNSIAEYKRMLQEKEQEKEGLDKYDNRAMQLYSEIESIKSRLAEKQAELDNLNEQINKINNIDISTIVAKNETDSSEKSNLIEKFKNIFYKFLNTDSKNQGSVVDSEALSNDINLPSEFMKFNEETLASVSKSNNDILKTNFIATHIGNINSSQLSTLISSITDDNMKYQLLRTYQNELIENGQNGNIYNIIMSFNDDSIKLKTLKEFNPSFELNDSAIYKMITELLTDDSVKLKTLLDYEYLFDPASVDIVEMVDAIHDEEIRLKAIQHFEIFKSVPKYVFKLLSGMTNDSIKQQALSILGSDIEVLEKLKVSFSEISDDVKNDVISLLSDDAKVQFINNYDLNSIYDAFLEMVFKSLPDDIKIQCLHNTELLTNYFNVYSIFESISDPTLRLKTVIEFRKSLLFESDRIVSRISDDIKLQFLTDNEVELDIYDKFFIVRLITDDDIKLQKLSQYDSILNVDQKKNIISSLSDDDIKLQTLDQYANLFDENQKCFVISEITNDIVKLQAFYKYHSESQFSSKNILQIIKSFKEESNKLSVLVNCRNLISSIDISIISYIISDYVKLQFLSDNTYLSRDDICFTIGLLENDILKLQALSDCKSHLEQSHIDSVIETITDENLRNNALSIIEDDYTRLKIAIESSNIETDSLLYIINSVSDSVKLQFLNNNTGITNYTVFYIISSLSESDDYIRLQTMVDHISEINNNDIVSILKSVTDDLAKEKILDNNPSLSSYHKAIIIDSIQDINKKNDIINKLKISNTENEFANIYNNESGQVGVDQDSINSIMRGRNIVRINTLIAQVKEYMPSMSTSDAVDFLRTIDRLTTMLPSDITIKGTDGVCNYAAVTNTIFEKYYGKEEQFEKEFGFPMYVDGSLNDAQLILDMFMTINTGEGKIFDNGTFHIDRVNNYTGLSSHSSKIYFDISSINEYFRFKGIDLVCESNINFDLMNINSLDNNIYSKLLLNDIMELLNNGVSLHIASSNGLEIIDAETGKIETLGGGHIMTIFGITEDGYLRVDSWGSEYRINMLNLLNQVKNGKINNIAISSLELVESGNNANVVNTITNQTDSVNSFANADMISNNASDSSTSSTLSLPTDFATFNEETLASVCESNNDIIKTNYITTHIDNMDSSQLSTLISSITDDTIKSQELSKHISHMNDSEIISIMNTMEEKIRFESLLKNIDSCSEKVIDKIAQNISYDVKMNVFYNLRLKGEKISISYEKALSIIKSNNTHKRLSNARMAYELTHISNLLSEDDYLNLLNMKERIKPSKLSEKVDNFIEFNEDTFSEVCKSDNDKLKTDFIVLYKDKLNYSQLEKLLCSITDDTIKSQALATCIKNMDGPEIISIMNTMEEKIRFKAFLENIDSCSNKIAYTYDTSVTVGEIIMLNVSDKVILQVLNEYKNKNSILEIDYQYAEKIVYACSEINRIHALNLLSEISNLSENDIAKLFPDAKKLIILKYSNLNKEDVSLTIKSISDDSIKLQSLAEYKSLLDSESITSIIKSLKDSKYKSIFSELSKIEDDSLKVEAVLNYSDPLNKIDKSSVIKLIVDDNVKLQILNNNPTLSSYHKAIIIDSIQDINKKNDIINKLKISNTENKFTNIYHNEDGKVGTNQGAIESIMRGRNIVRINTLIAQVKEYMPSMSTQDAVDFLRTIDRLTTMLPSDINITGTDGVCNYAAVANTIFEKYYGKEEQFEEDFGFPMYVDGSLNDAQLILDMIMIINTGEGKIFDNGTFYIDRVNKYTKLSLISSSQLYFYSPIINEYFRTKGIDLICESNTDFDLININSLDNDIYSKLLLNDIMELLNNGVSLHVASGKGLEIIDVETGKKIMLGGGHIMTIFGITEDGYLRVDSWGKEYRISVGDILNKVKNGKINNIAISSLELVESGSNTNVVNTTTNQTVSVNLFANANMISDSSTSSLQSLPTDFAIFNEETLARVYESNNDILKTNFITTHIDNMNSIQLSKLISSITDDNMKYQVLRTYQNELIENGQDGNIYNIIMSFNDDSIKFGVLNEYNPSLFTDSWDTVIYRVITKYLTDDSIKLNTLLTYGNWFDSRNVDIVEMVDAIHDENLKLKALENFEIFKLIPKYTMSIAESMTTISVIEQALSIIGDDAKVFKELKEWYMDFSDDFCTNALRLLSDDIKLQYLNDNNSSIFANKFSNMVLDSLSDNVKLQFLNDNITLFSDDTKLHSLINSIQDSELKLETLFEYKISLNADEIKSIASTIPDNVKLQFLDNNETSFDMDTKVFIIKLITIDGVKLQVFYDYLLYPLSSENIADIIKSLSNPNSRFETLLKFRGLLDSSSISSINESLNSYTILKEMKNNIQNLDTDTINFIFGLLNDDIIKLQALSEYSSLLSQENIDSIIQSLKDENLRNNALTIIEDDLLRLKTVFEITNLEYLGKYYIFESISDDVKLQFLSNLNNMNIINISSKDIYDIIYSMSDKYTKLQTMIDYASLLNYYEYFINTIGTIDDDAIKIKILEDNPSLNIHIKTFIIQSIKDASIKNNILDFYKITDIESDSINIYHNIDGRTGAEQGIIWKIMNSNDVSKQQVLIDYVKEKFPFMSYKDIEFYLKSIDVKTGGVCNYATVVNAIFEKYYGKEEQFEEHFGFPMYVDGSLNDAMLILDMFTIVNTGDGKIFDNGTFHTERFIPTNSSSSIYIPLADLTSFNVDAINEYFAKKGINITCSSNIVFDPNSINLLDKETYSIILANKLAELLSTGVSLHITSMSGLKMLDVTDNNIKKLTEGHIMTIFGITENGYLKVDSWGHECTISILDFLNSIKDVTTNIDGTTLINKSGFILSLEII